MTTSPVVVHLDRHAAPASWSDSDRGELARRLRPYGVSLTLLSDVLEHLGLPRLSAASPVWRYRAHLFLEIPQGQAALAWVQDRRAYLLECLGATDRATVRQARADLGLTRSTADLRLGELEALFSQARVVALLAEGETVPPRWTEAELFGHGGDE